MDESRVSCSYVLCSAFLIGQPLRGAMVGAVVTQGRRVRRYEAAVVGP